MHLVVMSSNMVTALVLMAMAMSQQGRQEVQVTPWWTGATTEEMVLVESKIVAKEVVKAKAIWLVVTAAGCGRVLSRSGPYGMSSSGQSGLN